MADAVGTQTETLFIRSLVYRLDVKKYFFKEIKVSFSIALILGGLLVLITYFWFGPPPYWNYFRGFPIFYHCHRFSSWLINSLSFQQI